MACGVVGCVARVAWPVEQIPSRCEECFFTLRHLAPTHVPWQPWLHVLSWEDWKVLPYEVVCPAKQYALQ
eukprot:301078-Lingulodinium_polyedra.AAC.1